MTAQLRENVETLERRVEERTAEINRQKPYFESLVEVSPVAVVTMDHDERVSAWNPAATALFGYSPDEAIGRSIDDLILRSDALRARATTCAARRPTSGRVHRIGRRMRKDGTLARRRDPDGPARGRRRAPRASTRSTTTSPSSRPRAARPSGEPGQERVPGRDEPRDPDADERGHRDERAAARHAARRRAARLRREHQHVGRGAAHDHQRHPRLLEDRGRPVRARVDPVRPRRDRSRAPSTSSGRSPRRRAFELVASSTPALPPTARRRRRPAPPDRPEPAVERRQVHRRRARSR